MVVVVVMVDRHTNGLPMVREEAEGGGGGHGLIVSGVSLLASVCNIWVGAQSYEGTTL